MWMDVGRTREITIIRGLFLNSYQRVTRVLVLVLRTILKFLRDPRHERTRSRSIIGYSRSRERDRE